MAARWLPWQMVNARPPMSADESWLKRLKRILIGNPLNLFDKSIFHTLALIPVLAWVGQWRSLSRSPPIRMLSFT